MGESWTDREEKEYGRLAGKRSVDRSAEEEMRLEHLKSRRYVAELDQRNAYLKNRAEMEKQGFLYKPAIVIIILGLGSCGIGAAAEDGGWALAGVGLVFLGGLVKGLNKKLMG